ncbi:MAG: hypothetical protein ATN36_03040 [Epulopiscium sp. Nele67-Bin005]|nr:MAG: hypothetical protein ATN36_03040 [Epulopiscium sp. Nele67-Bin005]
MENKQIATVNGREITEKDLQNLLQSLGQNAAQFRGAEGREHLIQELVAQELFYADAIDAGLDNDEEYQNAVKEMKTSLLKQYALSKFLTPITVTEEEAKNYFEAHKDIFLQAPKARASHILVPTKEEADDLLKDINSGKDFGELAQQNSSCPSGARGGDLGEFGPGQMVPEFDKVVFSMQPDEVSEPIETQFGFHIIKLQNISEAHSPEFAEVADQVTHMCLNAKRQDMYAEKTKDLEKIYPVQILEA